MSLFRKRKRAIRDLFAFAIDRGPALGELALDAEIHPAEIYTVRHSSHRGDEEVRSVQIQGAVGLTSVRIVVEDPLEVAAALTRAEEWRRTGEHPDPEPCDL